MDPSKGRGVTKCIDNGITGQKGVVSHYKKTLLGKKREGRRVGGDGVLMNGFEEEIEKLSAVDFGMRALAWSNIRVFVVEEGEGVVRNAQGFALEAKNP